MREIDRKDLGALVLMILEPDMVKAGIIPKDFDWKNISEEQSDKIQEFVKKELDKYKEKSKCKK